MENRSRRASSVSLSRRSSEAGSTASGGSSLLETGRSSRKNSLTSSRKPPIPSRFVKPTAGKKATPVGRHPNGAQKVPSLRRTSSVVSRTSSNIKNASQPGVSQKKKKEKPGYPEERRSLGALSDISADDPSVHIKRVSNQPAALEITPNIQANPDLHANVDPEHVKDCKENQDPTALPTMHGLARKSMLQSEDFTAEERENVSMLWESSYDVSAMVQDVLQEPEDVESLHSSEVAGAKDDLGADSEIEPVEEPPSHLTAAGKIRCSIGQPKASERQPVLHSDGLTPSSDTNLSSSKIHAREPSQIHEAVPEQHHGTSPVSVKSEWNVEETKQAPAEHKELVKQAASCRFQSCFSFRRSYFSAQVKEKNVVRCNLVRLPGCKMGQPAFYLRLCDEDHTPLLLARKVHGKNALAIFTASKTCAEEEVLIGELRGNFLGTEYSLKEYVGGDGNRRLSRTYSAPTAETMTVFYKHNLLGAAGPRKVRVILKSPEDQLCSRSSFSMRNLMRTFSAREPTADAKILRSKPAEWNSALSAYCLNFKGRVTWASVKNFQMVEGKKDGPVLLQFGKNGEHEFALDYSHPFSCVQAFALGLSSMYRKLACD